MLKLSSIRIVVIFSAQGLALHGKAMLGPARLGADWRSQAWNGVAKLGKVCNYVQSVQDCVRKGKAWIGVALPC